MKLLTQAEVRRITGSADPARQIRVLHRAGIYPVVRDDGRLVVSQEAVNSAMTGQRTEAPNYAALA